MDGAVAMGDRHEAGGDPFATTHWSVVLEAAELASPGASAALGSLYQAYSHPLYAYVRRRGYSEHDAQDLLHDFFQVLIEKNYLKSVSRERGRFRAFLLGSLKHFLAKDWNQAHRQKRGGEYSILSLDELLAGAERRLQFEAREEVPAEVLFDREWARTLLSRTMGRLRLEFGESNRLAQYEVLKVFLARPGDAESYARAGRQLGMSQRTVKVAVHRLRQRFQEILRRELGRTVGPAGDIEDELRHLVAVLRESAWPGFMTGDGI